jgi:hypothetical protein
MELDNDSEDSETPEVWNVSAALKVPGLISPIRDSKKKGETALQMADIMETRSNKGIKPSRTECVNVLSPSSLCSLTENFI